MEKFLWHLSVVFLLLFFVVVIYKFQMLRLILSNKSMWLGLQVQTCVDVFTALECRQLKHTQYIKCGVSSFFVDLMCVVRKRTVLCGRHFIYVELVLTILHEVDVTLFSNFWIGIIILFFRSRMWDPKKERHMSASSARHKGVTMSTLQLKTSPLSCSVKFLTSCQNHASTDTDTSILIFNSIGIRKILLTFL